MDADYSDRLQARFAATRAKFGVELPMLDWAAPQERIFLNCDEDELCKWVVEQYPDLSPFELIVEDVPLAGVDIITVLFAGMTRGEDRRFIEHRLQIELEQDLVWYTERVYFSIVSSVKVTDESDLVRIRTPRWVNR